MTLVVVLVALFLIIAIILMLVVLGKNTGGKEGGIGCVSGAILFGMFLLVMTRSQELKNQGGPNPISTIEGFLNALPILLAWLVGVILATCILGGLGYLAHRLIRNGADRKSDRDYWMDMLAPLAEDDFDAMATHHRSEINAAFRSDDWVELRRRRLGVGSLSPPIQQEIPSWGWVADLARWTPLVLIAAALLWQLGLGIIRWAQPSPRADQGAAKPVLRGQQRPHLRKDQSAGPEHSPTSDWMERYEYDQNSP